MSRAVAKPTAAPRRAQKSAAPRASRAPSHSVAMAADALHGVRIGAPNRSPVEILEFVAEFLDRLADRTPTRPFADGPGDHRAERLEWFLTHDAPIAMLVGYLGSIGRAADAARLERATTYAREHMALLDYQFDALAAEAVASGAAQPTRLPWVAVAEAAATTSDPDLARRLADALERDADGCAQIREFVAGLRALDQEMRSAPAALIAVARTSVPISADEARRQIYGVLMTTGAFVKQVSRLGSGDTQDPLYRFRTGGPGRTPRGRYVAHEVEAVAAAYRATIDGAGDRRVEAGALRVAERATAKGRSAVRRRVARLKNAKIRTAGIRRAAAWTNVDNPK